MLFRSGDFNPQTIAMWRILIAQGHWTHVVDVGANYGEMLVGAELPPSAAIIAIEPNPYLLPYLVRTIEDGGIKVEVVTQAASECPGQAELIVDRTWSGMSSLAGLQRGAETHTVEIIEVSTTTLAAVVGARSAGQRVRVLTKIDVEGHEAAVLKGASEMIDDAEAFAALVEILHATDQELDWLLANFAIELYDPQSAALVRIDARAAHELREAIASKGYYPQDAVLRRRTRGK